MPNDDHFRYPEITCDADIFVHYFLKDFQEYPIINERVLLFYQNREENQDNNKRNLTSTILASYYIMRQVACKYDKPGYLPRHIAIRLLIYYLDVSKQHAGRLLDDGNHLLWRRGTNKLKEDVYYIFSPHQIAELLKIELDTIESYYSPIRVLSGGIKRRSAHFFKTVECKNDPIPTKPQYTRDQRENRRIGYKYNKKVKTTRMASKPISRDTLKKRTGISKPIQRSYEKNCNQTNQTKKQSEEHPLDPPIKDTVYKDHNWLSEKELTQEEYEEIQQRIKSGEEVFYKGQPLNSGKYRLYREWPSYVGCPDDAEARYYIGRQLPNSYSDNRTKCKRYRLKRRNTEANVRSAFLDKINVSEKWYNDLLVIRPEPRYHPYQLSSETNILKRVKELSRLESQDKFTIGLHYPGNHKHKRLVIWIPVYRYHPTSKDTSSLAKDLLQ